MDQALLALMKQLSAEEKLMFQSDYEDQKKSTVLAVVLALLVSLLLSEERPPPTDTCERSAM